jgi:N-acetylglucosamine kinase-like BadF-type ATPase
MPPYFLGVDVGGTKTHALIADEAGRAVGFGVGGSGNPHSETYEGMMRGAITPAVEGALASAKVSKARIAGAGYGIAGYDWPSERERTLRALDSLGLSAPREIVNDSVVGLLAGAEQGWGVAVVAGTGCNCRGWDVNRREGRVTGLSEFGEAAGGGQVVERALQAVAKAWSLRGPATQLTEAFVAKVGARDAGDLLEGLFVQKYHLDADAAPLVFKVAAEGDSEARAVLTWAGQELASLANGIIRQLNFEQLAFDVILVGSLWDGGPLLLDPMREAVRAVASGARFVRLAAPPVVGGVLLGMELGGLKPYGLRDRLISTTKELLNGNGQ